MVIDASAFAAIVLGEPERRDFSGAITSSAVRLTSTGTVLEATMVLLGRRGQAGVDEFGAFLQMTNIDVVPFTTAQLAYATEAFRRFGKGRHPAALNYGDCFSYALARATDEPLLFKGEDFLQTDVKRVFEAPRRPR